MKKLENFSNCLEVLKSADFEIADNNDIYRTGVIGQFNLTFELAWKALQEILNMYDRATVCCVNRGYHDLNIVVSISECLVW